MPRMDRVSSLTVKTLAELLKRSLVKAMREEKSNDADSADGYCPKRSLCVPAGALSPSLR